MITERDLAEAIAECEGQRKPNANTCIKLAAFYTIRRELYGERQERSMGISEAPPPSPSDGGKIDLRSGSDFARAVAGKTAGEVLPVIDDLMETLQVINPRLYNGAMRELG